MPGRKSLPDTLRRSPAKAQRTWVKHSSQKKGDRWVPKGSRGPSDPRAKKGAGEARRDEGETFGGIDYYGSTKEELYDRAKKLDVQGRSGMSKKELARAIARKQ